MMCRPIYRSFLLTAMLLSSPVFAEQLDIEVVGLFSNAALLRIDGRQMLLRTGEKSPEGVTLIDANSREAIIEYQNEHSTLFRSNRIASEFKKPEVVSVSVQMNERGQYITMGSINGRPVSFLIDTGANIVAMNSEMAKSLGIDLSGGKEAASNTAGGVIRSREITLESVQVGEIIVTNVRIAVLEGKFPTEVLLGMSFLKSVKMQENAGLMVLTSQF
ncbi:MAG: TIGR02281 family clan AA aspartic protease [Gammaproteobacteria bacterium]|mgnify:CR=1 FL=1|nr:TIGR02281 family clan AA aspartic protease [Gammaproteobacteria bacterium]